MPDHKDVFVEMVRMLSEARDAVSDTRVERMIEEGERAIAQEEERIGF